MTNSQRQHGIGSLAPDEKIVGKPGGLVEPGVKQYGIFKKIKKAVKKVVKSPIGKIGLGALLAGAPIGGGAWFGSGSGWGKGMGLLRSRLPAKGVGKFLYSPAAGKGSGNIFSKAYGGLKNFGLGKAAFLGAGAGLTALPFLG